MKNSPKLFDISLFKSLKNDKFAEISQKAYF